MAERDNLNSNNEIKHTVIQYYQLFLTLRIKVLLKF